MSVALCTEKIDDRRRCASRRFSPACTNTPRDVYQRRAPDVAAWPWARFAPKRGRLQRCEPHWLVGLDVPLQRIPRPGRSIRGRCSAEFHAGAPAWIKLLASVQHGRPPLLQGGELPLDCCDETQIIGRIGDLSRGIVESACMLSQADGGPHGISTGV